MTGGIYDYKTKNFTYSKQSVHRNAGKGRHLSYVSEKIEQILDENI